MHFKKSFAKESESKADPIISESLTTSRSFFFQKKLFTVDVNETQNFLCSSIWNDCKLYMSKIFGLQMDNCKMQSS